MAGLVQRCVWVALLAILAWASHATSRTLSDRAMLERHEQWMAEHGRLYKDAAEKEGRFKIFKANVELIESFNAGNLRYKLGLNRFADLTNDEYKHICSGFNPPKLDMVKTPSSFTYENATMLPTSIDWRAKGAVTPVKDQGHCGSCWAFSAVATVEGVTKLKTGKLIPLSEQELLDTDINGENRGCDGGIMDSAFEFIINKGGLTVEAYYPYKGTDNNDHIKSTSPRAVINSYEDVPKNSEAALLKAVANQPVSIAVDASAFAFQFYSGGVFTGDCGTDLNHGVTVVGYGMDNDGIKYWLVKNSWGSSWGEDGYIRMERDVDAKEGLCGIAMQASYPIA